MKLTSEEWRGIREQRVSDAHARLLALPKPYQEWVTRQAHGRGIPTLRRNTPLGPGEVVVYDALISRCEREFKKPDQPAGET